VSHVWLFERDKSALTWIRKVTASSLNRYTYYSDWNCLWISSVPATDLPVTLGMTMWHPPPRVIFIHIIHWSSEFHSLLTVSGGECTPVEFTADPPRTELSVLLQTPLLTCKFRRSLVPRDLIKSHFILTILHLFKRYISNFTEKCKGRFHNLWKVEVVSAAFSLLVSSGEILICFSLHFASHLWCSTDPTCRLLIVLTVCCRQRLSADGEFRTSPSTHTLLPTLHLCNRCY
jgi:hypothetical protein